ncbi:MAG: glycerol-3-phosphate 1-O-acyltransferase PlsY [Alphaproteobacteria bacterium]|jgi:glycerol-3-phosphate acyltransferase PlsY|nr:glycerol-3-phosphate 1-O-acyltransferase PlsY [Alphaproteobacteria bacterium]
MPDPLGDFSYTWPFYAAALFGYLLGSIPFGLVLTKMAGLGDVRNIGSGSIGATNVLRTGRKGLALATMLLDIGKGAVAVLIANIYGPDIAVLAAGGAMLGHCFPVWLKFKGGKGVATAAGILLAIAPFVGLAAFGVWLVTVVTTRYSSLGALVAVIAAPILAYYLANLQIAELAAFMAVLITFRHHQNIRRLLSGTESRISFSRKKPDGSE